MLTSFNFNYRGVKIRTIPHFGQNYQKMLVFLKLSSLILSDFARGKIPCVNARALTSARWGLTEVNLSWRKGIIAPIEELKRSHNIILTFWPAFGIIAPTLRLRSGQVEELKP